MDEINTEVEQLYADVKGIIWNYCSYFPFKDDVELKTLYKWDYANDNTHILATCHSIAVHDEMVYICYDDINSWCIYNITTKQNHAIKIEPLPIEYEECYMIVRNIGDIILIFTCDDYYQIIDVDCIDGEIALISTDTCLFRKHDRYQIWYQGKTITIVSVSKITIHNQKVYYFDGELCIMDLKTGLIEKFDILEEIDLDIFDPFKITIDPTGQYINFLTEDWKWTICNMNGRVIRQHDLSQIISGKYTTYQMTFHESVVYIYNNNIITKLTAVAN